MKPSGSSAADSLSHRQISALYAVYFVAHGIAIPYLPVTMKRIGLDGGDIGSTMAIALAIQFLAPPVWGYLADRSGSRRGLVQLSAMGAVTGLLVAALVPGKLGFIAGFLFFVFSRSPVGPLLDALALGHRDIGVAGFGAVRLWGSVGFIAGVVATGALLDIIAPLAIPLMVAFWWILLASLWVHLHGPIQEVPAPPASGLPLRALYGQKHVWAFLLLSAFHFGCGVPFDTYFANHASDIGLPGYWIGLSWAGGVSLEVAILGCLGTLVHRFGPKKILLFSYGIGSLRWALTSILPAGIPLAAVQILHGFTFGAAYGASVVWMNRSVPREIQNSSQAVFAAMSFGLGGIAAQALCGPFYEKMGGHSLFAAAAVLQLLPVLGMVFLREPKERGAAQE